MDDGFGQTLSSKVMPPPKKRSLFNTAALAQASEATDAVEFFSRARELQPQRLAEDERRRQRKLLKGERKKSPARTRKASTPPELKRKRVATRAENNSPSDSPARDEPDSLAYTQRESSESALGSWKHNGSPDRRNVRDTISTLASTYNEALRSKQKSPSVEETISKDIISIEDSDSDDEKSAIPDIHTIARPTFASDEDTTLIPQRKAPQQDDNELQFSDEDEFLELIQAARDREAQRTEQRQKAPKSFEMQNQGSNGMDSIFQLDSADSEADPSVEILVTSMIEGTKPLRVRRKVSQRLQRVKQVWCDRQSCQGTLAGLDPMKDIFLTWRTHRLYDASTCRGLALKFDGSGRVSVAGEGVVDGRIHLEAWTQDMYDAFRKREAARLQEGEGESDGEETVEEAKVEETKIRIIMKAKGLDPFKVFVRPHTSIEKMIDLFRRTNEVPDEKTITIYFDGDVLEPAMNAEQCDLGDKDTVDVYIR